MTASQLREIKLLGEGAQARCFLVERTATNELFCEKRMAYKAGEQAAEQAVREVEILCKLSHPNITRIFAAWRSSDARIGPSLSILMEYADGGSLAEALKSRALLDSLYDEARVMDWFVQVCAAIAHMHSCRVLHRDLKAANIFLTSRSLVKVGDFGIAKCLEGSGDGALARTTIGTPYYLAPELINGDAYDYKADVWALGVLLYEMLALRRPFEADTLPALALKIVRVSYPPVPTSGGYSREVSELLSSMLRKDPKKRPSAAHVLEAPIVRRHHDRLHAQLRSLATLVAAEEAAAAPPAQSSHRGRGAFMASAETSAPPPPLSPQAAAAPAAAAEASPALAPAPAPAPSCGASQQERAAGCAMLLGSGLHAASSSAAAAASPPPPAAGCMQKTATYSDAGPGAGMAAAPAASPLLSPLTARSPACPLASPSLEESLRFTQNLHALEANLKSLEQVEGSLPERTTPRRALGAGGAAGATSPFSCSSTGGSLTGSLLASPPPCNLLSSSNGGGGGGGAAPWSSPLVPMSGIGSAINASPLSCGSPGCHVSTRRKRSVMREAPSPSAAGPPAAKQQHEIS